MSVLEECDSRGECKGKRCARIDSRHSQVFRHDHGIAQCVKCMGCFFTKREAYYYIREVHHMEVMDYVILSWGRKLMLVMMGFTEHRRYRDV